MTGIKEVKLLLQLMKTMGGIVLKQSVKCSTGNQQVPVLATVKELPCRTCLS